MKLTTKYLLALIATVLLLNLSVAEALRYNVPAGRAGATGPQGPQGPQGPPGGVGLGSGQYTIPYPIYQGGVEVTQFDDIVLSSIKYNEATLAVTLTTLINDIFWALQPDGSYQSQAIVDDYHIVYPSAACTGQPYLLATGWNSQQIIQPTPKQSISAYSSPNAIFIKPLYAPTYNYTAGANLTFLANHTDCHDISTSFPSQWITELHVLTPPTSTTPITFIYPPI